MERTCKNDYKSILSLDCGETFELTNEQEFLLTSYGLIAPKLHEACSWSFFNKFDNSGMSISLLEYNKINEPLSSRLLVYGYNEESGMSKVLKFDILNKTLLNDQYIGNNGITIQFFRSNFNNDNFKSKIYTMLLKSFNFFLLDDLY